MPTHDRATILPRAVSSVLAQTFPDWELIVVDDASSDGTADVVASFGDRRIRYRRNERPLGPSDARNAGILAASPGSRFLAFLDDDDEWYPHKLHLQLEVARKGPPDLIVVGCDRTEYDPLPVTQHSQHRGRIFEELLARQSAGYGGQQLLVRRRRGEPDLLFDPNLPCLEDADYVLRLSRMGSLDFVPKPLVKIYRNYGGQHVWNSEGMVLGYDRMAEKYITELAARPWVRSYYRFCAARGLAELGRMAECRRRLRLAIADALRPARLRCWYAATFLGRPGVRVARRFLPVPLPQVRPGVPAAAAATETTAAA
jgi:glycosyltransferase involved in cell wall biosynthesis